MMEQTTEQAAKGTGFGRKMVATLNVGNVTGVAWLAAAVGVLIEVVYHEFVCVVCAGEATIGLIPLYLGFPIGAIGFVILLRRKAGWIPAFLGAAGLVGVLYFMFSYPDGATGWIGALFVGMAHLFLPLPVRFAAVLWIVTGVLGFPEFGSPTWGWISAFSVFGAATAYSGAFAIWGSWGNGRESSPEQPETNESAGG